MKAWAVTEQAEGLGYIVYSPTRGVAKSLAQHEPGMYGAFWTDIIAHRLPRLDGFRECEGSLDWTKDARIYYEAGWWPDCDSKEECEDCGLFVFENIPESQIDEDSGICAGCRISRLRAWSSNDKDSHGT